MNLRIIVGGTFVLVFVCGHVQLQAQVSFGNSGVPNIYGSGGTFLGTLNANPYDPNSISNPYGQYGSPYSPTSINNPYSTYGSSYSPSGVNNKYTTGGPTIFASDGTYLGRLNANPYDPQSVSNPYGQYGSPYSPTSINNPYSTYGSPYSPSGVRNRFGY